MYQNLIELNNIESSLNSTKNLKNLSCVKGEYKYFHYCCDDFNDVGYGCGYRTTQTICSWIKNQIFQENIKFNTDQKLVNEPSILEIQKILVECGDKPSSFIGSKDWIGSFEANIVIDYLYNVPSKIIHCSAGKLHNYIQDLSNHFRDKASPIMMGGDLDNASKGVIGVSNENNDSHLLIVDPHYSKRVASKSELINDEWINWKSISFFDTCSFYNFCIPQKKAIEI